MYVCKIFSEIFCKTFGHIKLFYYLANVTRRYYATVAQNNFRIPTALVKR